ncbi:hypothetical protein CQA49_06910 [Helicobacter sp. MIT 00-7814]|uniref:tyrosine-type recombinase/integrase n=1 Tax=unclassified Helicobacter TaxID=2593540 RepID=UPI000E1E6C3A|nr:MULTISPECIES: site-specific integrase [unclassified Helicobacter]RDU52824.1 hypothetical protein CQA37_08080 [Helicobacter sp. MIT 99-10781]RDU53237.1 hypothetical protein CQA49_06910 [Helicobacter sp. MIT 00-7814]
MKGITDRKGILWIEKMKKGERIRLSTGLKADEKNMHLVSENMHEALEYFEKNAEVKSFFVTKINNSSKNIANFSRKSSKAKTISKSTPKCGAKSEITEGNRKLWAETFAMIKSTRPTKKGCVCARSWRRSGINFHEGKSGGGALALAEAILQNDTPKSARLSQIISDLSLEHVTLKESTKTSYLYAQRKLLAFFGDVEIGKITRQDIAEFYKYLSSNSKSRARYLMGYLGRIFERARVENLITKSPMFKAKLACKEAKEIQPFSENEISLLLQNCQDALFREFLRFSFFSGARVGEIVALQWSDIDFEKREISISKTLNRRTITSPKTHSSIRKIIMLPPLLESLTWLKNNAKAKSPFIFCNALGKPISQRYRNTSWVNLLQKCNLPHRVLYNTRHSFASIMLSRGENIGWISQTLGHKNSHITLSVYAKYVKNESYKPALWLYQA